MTTATPATPAAPTPAPTPTPGPAKAHWDTLGNVAPRPVSDVHAARLADGRVLFLGQREDAGDLSIEPYASVWDPGTRNVRVTTPLGVEEPVRLGISKPGSGTPRTEYVVVSLTDGRAMVIGGTNDRWQSYASTWIFDVSGGGSWTKTGLLNQARSAPCAAVLENGRVLVAGGYFHVEPDWYHVEPDSGAVQAPIVLAIAHPGGSGGGLPPLDDMAPPYAGAAMATAELFDPATGTWSKTGAMRYARAGCQAATLADGRVLVVGSANYFGGVGIDGRALDTAEIYDPTTGRFTLAGQLPRVDRQKYPALYKAEPHAQKGGGSLVALEDGGAVLIGYQYYWKHQGEATRSFRFGAAKKTWTEIGPTFGYYGDWESERWSVFTRGVRDLAGAQVAALLDGRVLVAGGRSIYEPARGTNTTRAVLAYNPRTNRWQDLPNMPEAREGGVAVTMADGSVVIAGGHDPDWSELRSFVCFTPAR